VKKVRTQNLTFKKYHKSKEGSSASSSESHSWSDISRESADRRTTQGKTKVEKLQLDKPKVPDPAPEIRQPDLTTKICIVIASRNEESLSQKFRMAPDISIVLSMEEEIYFLSRRLGQSEFTTGLPCRFLDGPQSVVIPKDGPHRPVKE
jgi:hypothetical protein